MANEIKLLKLIIQKSQQQRLLLFKTCTASHPILFYNLYRYSYGVNPAILLN